MNKFRSKLSDLYSKFSTSIRKYRTIRKLHRFLLYTKITLEVAKFFLNL
jgi:hypothetical protein